MPASITKTGAAGAGVFVRLNAELDTALKDAEAAVNGGAFGLYVAKASVAHIAAINSFLDRMKTQKVALVALIEDASSLLEAHEIAQQPRLMALTVGAEDLAHSLGAAPDPDVLRQPKLMVHYAAKAQGLRSFGMFKTTADYANTDEIMASAREAKRHGFDGASCVHPSVIPLLNKAFSATPEDIAWAKKVLSAAAGAQGGAFSLDGKMVDLPVLERARRILKE